MFKKILIHTRRSFKLIILLAISAILIVGVVTLFYKPTYSVTIDGKQVGYTKNKSELQKKINEYVENGDWNSPVAVLKAAELATKMRYECLRKRQDFVFETVFSSDEKLAFVEEAKKAGFFIRIFFVCTNNPEINVRRITQRYLNGGHEVPISKIISRYYKSLLNIGKAISLVDRVYVYDNSIENQIPRLLFRTVNGTLFKQYVEEIPQWAQFLIK